MEELNRNGGSTRGRFSYHLINESQQGITEEEIKYFTVSSKNDPFIAFKKFKSTPNPDGWKVHISLLENDENIARV